MNIRKVFCKECRSDTACVVSAGVMTGAIRDKEYSYPGHEALCAICGSPVFVPENCGCQPPRAL